MSLVLVIEFRAKPERWDEFKNLMNEILPDTAAFDGCGLLHAAAIEDEHMVVLYEEWRDEAARNAYFNWRKERGDLERMAAYMREAPVRRTGTPIAF